MDTFFIKYGKLVTVICIICILFFPFEVYQVVENLNSNKTGKGIGTLVNAVVVDLAVPGYLLYRVRQANKKNSGEKAANSVN